MSSIASTKKREPIATADLHAWFRFSTGIMLAFVLSETMGWSPTFLAPVLFAVLITSLAAAPPPKLGLALILIMAAAVLTAFLLSSLLRASPQILLAAIAAVIFLAFATMAQARGRLPATFMLISISTIPVITMIAPGQAGVLPVAMVRAMAVAVVLLYCMYAAWPEAAARTAAPAASPVAAPVRKALIGTSIVMPVMLVYLLFGLADALPVLVTVVMLVTTFDAAQGSAQGMGMILGNLVGGLFGFGAFLVLAIAPSLITLALITFLIAAGFASRINKGGPTGALALLICNSSLIILSTALADPASSAGVWLARVFQFALASLFAIAMMSVFWRTKPSTGP